MDTTVVGGQHVLILLLANTVTTSAVTVNVFTLITCRILTSSSLSTLLLKFAGYVS